MDLVAARLWINLATGAMIAVVGVMRSKNGSSGDFDTYYAGPAATASVRLAPWSVKWGPVDPSVHGGKKVSRGEAEREAVQRVNKLLGLPPDTAGA
jgi:hypothetical protein